MKRTDLHRPSVVNPADYDFIACFYSGTGLDAAMANLAAQQEFRAHMEHTGGKFARITYDDGSSGSTGCDVCGARCANTARFHHVPSNTYITTGLDCAAKMSIGNALEFRSFQKRIAAGLKTQRGKLKAQRELEAAGLGRAWAIWEADQAVIRSLQNVEGSTYPWPPKQETTIIDIVNRVIRYGEPSEAQTKYLHSLLKQIDERAVTAAKRAAEMETAAPVPATDKRVKIAGKVLSLRNEEGTYGPVRKMLVQHADGYKLWGNAPSCLWSAKVGDTVEFDAKITRSERDSKFGFYSRPTKASVINALPLETASV